MRKTGINSSNICIHYDVYPSSKLELNEILFEILILGCINDHFQKIYKIPDHEKIFVEISQSLNDQFYKLFLSGNIKTIEYKWDFAGIKIKA